VERVTVTLPGDLVRDIDRQDGDRSEFVAEAIRRELERRQREEFRRSLKDPHPESLEFADQGLADWSLSLPQENAEALLDAAAGITVRWIPGEGWSEGRE
jgi:Arc/MetJ-type ribon-helix-helix transcriptional regulator